MDGSPRSSKRRKLDRPTHKPSSPLVKSTLRKGSARTASRTSSLLNGDTVDAEDDAATPSRRTTRKPARAPNGTTNGTIPRQMVDEKDVYDDIEGALPVRDYSPAPSLVPSTRPSTKSRRKKDVFDNDSGGSATPNLLADGDTTNGNSVSRSPFRALVNGYRHGASLEANIQDELAAQASTPSKRAKKGHSASEEAPSPARGQRNTSARLNKRITRNVSGRVGDQESADPLQADGSNGSRWSRTPILKEKTGASREGEVMSATPSRSLRRRAPIPDSEDELGDQDPPSRTKSVRDRRRANRADHFSNQEEIIQSHDHENEDDVAPDTNGIEADTMDVDGNSVLGSVLDPTEPSPFNKPTSAQEAKETTTLLQGRLPAGRELDLLRTIVMERITGKRPAPLIGLDDEYSSVYQLVEHTITAGEGNSMLLIGARGSGKTALVNKVLSEVSKDNSEDYHVVRLNGFIHTDDKIALREIWRQLGKEMDIEEDGGLGKNYADTLTTLLALLSHPSEQTGELTDHVAKAVIFVMDEFDLFASHPRQTLLYNLFDIAQSRKAPIAVLGLTTRIDVANSLEKRVKSRFSHRYVHLSLAKTFTSFQEICKASLFVQPEHLSVEERSILGSALTSTTNKNKKSKKTAAQDILTEWNSNISTLFASASFLTDHLAPHFYITKSIPTVLTSFLYPTATLSLSISTLTPSALLSPPDSKLALIPHLSTLSLSLLIAAARLDIIHDSDTCNFNMAYDEYVTLTSKARIQSAAGGASASGSVSKVWGKEVAKREWEGLVELGLVMPVVGAAAAGQSGGFGMCRADIALEEIGAVVSGDKGIERMLERWCRQL